MKMTDMSTKKLEELHLSVLAYGGTGTGKTRFASTFPSPVYVADFDGGLLTVYGKEGVAGDTYRTVKRNGVVIKEAWNELMALVTDLEEDLSKCPDFEEPLKTLVVDSVTTLEQRCIEAVCKEAGHLTPTQPDWGEIIRRLIDLFERLNDLPCYTIVTAHELMEKDEVSGRIVIRPSISTRKLPNRISVYFDEVYRLYARRNEGTQEYMMHTKAGVNYDGKSRLNLPDPAPTTFQSIADSAQEAGG